MAALTIEAPEARPQVRTLRKAGSSEPGRPPTYKIPRSLRHLHVVARPEPDGQPPAGVVLPTDGIDGDRDYDYAAVLAELEPETRPLGAGVPLFIPNGGSLLFLGEPHVEGRKRAEEYYDNDLIVIEKGRGDSERPRRVQIIQATRWNSLGKAMDNPPKRTNIIRAEQAPIIMEMERIDERLATGNGTVSPEERSVLNKRMTVLSSQLPENSRLRKNPFSNDIFIGRPSRKDLLFPDGRVVFEAPEPITIALSNGVTKKLLFNKFLRDLASSPVPATRT